MREKSEKVKISLYKKKIKKETGVRGKKREKKSQREKEEKKESEEKRRRKKSQRKNRRYALVPSYVDTNGEKFVPVRTNIRNKFLKYFQN